ncbi:VOC family protein [Candidatus Nitrosocosmicus hydrocola]|uniref:VOC family protein n=1 Tax=Candidatus Nitrosocosmicus hydrocola TaxID=1826872 RepID=UPI0011E5F8F1|nr:VOC family protein [Candidatus Nitrosocosmicus hydrocola]
MPTVQHFEIPVDDVDRAQKFYKVVFSWSMQKWSNPTDPSQEYFMFETSDESGNKGIGGGLMKRQSPQQTVTNYVTVSSIDEYTSKVEQSGGKIIMPKTEIPDIGYILVFMDTENNMLGLYEAKK